MNEKIRVWQTQITAINHKTGDLEQFISPHYVEGVNFEEAHNNLNKIDMPYLQLNGVWFDSAEEAAKLSKFYEDLTEPYNLVKGMDYDEFVDWLSLGNEEDIIAALIAFKRDGRVNKYVDIIIGYLKYKYNNNNAEEDK